jgi:uncharacterized damage-inducible protein DinB
MKGKMLGKDIFLYLARYNQRANAEMFQVLAKLTDKARRRDTGSWFGSLQGLVNHLIVADLHWLQRFKPVFPESAVLNDPRLSPAGLSWKQDLRENFEELQEEHRFVDERLIAWFEECPEDRYGDPFQYTDSAGNLRSAIVGQAFTFLFVHQTHHRGQVAQVLDTLGLPNSFADNVAFLEGPR